MQRCERANWFLKYTFQHANGLTLNFLLYSSRCFNCGYRLAYIFVGSGQSFYHKSAKKFSIVGWVLFGVHRCTWSQFFRTMVHRHYWNGCFHLQQALYKERKVYKNVGNIRNSLPVGCHPQTLQRNFPTGLQLTQSALYSHPKFVTCKRVFLI